MLLNFNIQTLLLNYIQRLIKFIEFYTMSNVVQESIKYFSENLYLYNVNIDRTDYQNYVELYRFFNKKISFFYSRISWLFDLPILHLGIYLKSLYIYN